MNALGRKIVFSSQNSVEIQEFDIPTPQTGQLLIRTAKTLISAGTELSILTASHSGFTDPRIGYPPYPFYPFDPGYSNSGVIVAMGSSVQDFEVGERVYSQTIHASHVVVDATPWNVQKIPAHVSDDAATSVLLGKVALWSVHRAGVLPGEAVAVVGQGLVGQLCLQCAKLTGATTLIAVDLLDDRLELSRTHGASHTINPVRQSLDEAVQSITDGKGASVVIEASGNPKALHSALQIAGVFGRVVLAGCQHGKVEINPYTDLHTKGLTIMGAPGRLVPTTELPQYPWSRQSVHRLFLDLLAKGRVSLAGLLTHTIPYYEAPETYLRLLERPNEFMGVVLDWSGV